MARHQSQPIERLAGPQTNNKTVIGVGLDRKIARKRRPVRKCNMSNLDRFESIFRSATRHLFHFQANRVRTVVVISDGDENLTRDYANRIQRFLDPLFIGPEFQVVYQPLPGDRFDRVSQLVNQVSDLAPDLICTHRNLHTPIDEFPHSLGSFVDVLTQATSIPILLLPRPQRLAADPELSLPVAPRRVLALTDHLAGEDRLVSWAATFTAPDGDLYLTHVEDEQTFERYIDTIAKIPEIDTDLARTLLLRQLLKDPQDYIQTCITAVKEAGFLCDIHPLITVGHYLSDIRRLIDQYEVDLVVTNTKDEDQMAMHGLAYELAIELKQKPLLLV